MFNPSMKGTYSSYKELLIYNVLFHCFVKRMNLDTFQLHKLEYIFQRRTGGANDYSLLLVLSVSLECLILNIT